MNASQRAAKRFLNELKTINPAAYALLMNNNNKLGFVGAEDWNTPAAVPSTMGSFWTDVGDALSTTVTTAIDKEQARQEAKVAEQRARALLAEEQARLDIALQQQQTAARSIELQREQLSLTQAFKDLEFSGVQTAGLWIAGGLALWLVWRLATQ